MHALLRINLDMFLYYIDEWVGAKNQLQKVILQLILALKN